MQKELNDEEFLEYIAMTMSREMFPTGRPEKVQISGISLNYAFIGAAKSRQRKGCSKNVEEIPTLKNRLYWNAVSHGKKVVGLVHEGDCNAWVVPGEWVGLGKTKAKSEVIVTFPQYEKDLCNDLEGRLALRCTKQDADYKVLVSFLSSFKGTRRQALMENNEFCMKCLFLFYPSLLNEFCNDLMNWCHDRVMGEAEYAQVNVILKAMSEYLKLLEGLKAMGKGVLSANDVINVLNQHQLQVLSFKMGEELKDNVAKNMLVECLKRNVCRGILNMHSIDNLKFNIDQNIRGGKELVQALWDIKNLATAIRKLE